MMKVFKLDNENMKWTQSMTHAQRNDSADVENHCFHLDRNTQSLVTDNKTVRLRSKLWSVLTHLIQNKNSVVLRATLVEDIWHGNAYTGEQGLTHAVCHLRKILKDCGLRSKIITLPKRGYIFDYQDQYKIEERPELVKL